MPGTLRTLWRLMHGQRLRYAAAIGAIGMVTLVSYLVPLVGRAAIDGSIAKVAEERKQETGDREQRTAPKPTHSRAWDPHSIVNLFGGAEHLAANLWLAALAMALLTGIAGLFTYAKGRWSAAACEGIARKLRNQLYDHLNKLPCSYLDKADTGDLVQRCTSDVETTRLFLSVQVVEIGNALILLFTVVPIMLALHAGMTLVSLVLVPVIVFFSLVFFIKVKHRFKAVEEAESKLTTVVQENLTGIRVVRAFARQEFEREKFAAVNAEYRNRSFKLVSLLAWFWTMSDLLVLLQMCLALAFGAYWVARGELTVGDLFAFLAYLQLMLWPVRQMGRVLTDMGKALVALGRIREILNVGEESESDSPPFQGGVRGESQRTESSDARWRKEDADAKLDTALTPALSPGERGPEQSAIRNPQSAIASPTGAITIRNLTFAYATSTQPVLSDIDIAVAAGQSLAIVGPSGAGKSTLMALLLRLYDYDKGEILFDDREIRSLPRPWVRSHIGVVMQEPFLFAKSLGDNIRHGKSDAMETEIQEAAQAAQIHDTITGFEKRYDTIIGERGVNLSGGQRQRVAIARAVVRDPAILILDDALSAVDSRTEAEILGALRTRRGRRTTILIAHRLSTLMQADQIIVLDKGRIVQRGTHETLRGEEGLYRRLWRIQSDVEEDLQRELQSV